MSEDPYELLKSMTEKAMPKLASKVGGPVKVFQFTGEGYEPFYIEVGGGSIKLNKGTHRSPTATIQVNRENLLKLIKGQLDAMQAYFSGIIKVTGNIMDAATLIDIMNTARTA
ncbi:MAG: SCP2 sterol-binding domain-containing protein [Vulcanisaeta sp.]|jgi:putative sterol carrier protein|nr:SCP2 sterol-binding domain-containing protein [Vulcanisaeta sp.]MCG2870149.1 SCP2 sterol-binding domain-containing protein [Vulcanisaeta sp.]MCG2879778.1 SCP2 sterol-binding domain-containing protein [Vulcanisaeta sp.]MCG2886432.1 SCP2 sterol-binding domain-containing protein [Vulcanisaeta sp.]MCG2892109.1 SCP2 sterol-binding domain-containing protein [Vulcanisaeta sp.]